MMMEKRDERIDAYIAKSADFAKPILIHLRELIHEAFPAIEEAWKWSFPHFDHKGIVCSMAAFKQHCTFGFWKASLMNDADNLFIHSDTAMGKLGQIKSLEDLPPDDVLISYIREAVELNEKGVKLPSKERPAVKKELEIPDYFISALNKNKQAAETFKNFNYSNKKEYVEWVTEAKTEETRNKRIAAAIEQIAEGKSRHWKYARG